MTIEIVDFPIENGGTFHSYVNVYQRVYRGKTKISFGCSSDDYMIYTNNLKFPRYSN
jgi:hypothetical protein